jgi:putative protease
MNIITYVESLYDLSILKQLKISCAIVSLASFSKEGIETSKALKLVKIASEMGIELSLEMDSLFIENDLKMVITYLDEVLVEEVSSVRVSDIGVAKYIRDYYPSIKIELYTETIGANLEALKEHQRYFGMALSSLLLSVQLSKEQLSYFCSNLSVDKELLILGRIPLFYSPRHLLTGDRNHKRVEMIASSEETPHSGFSVVENISGTFMYHPKDIFLLDKIDELKNIGVGRVRVDVRHLPVEAKENILRSCQMIINDKINFKELKNLYPRKVIRGYYSANRSNVLFGKLKNPHLIKDDNSHIGYVLAIKKREYLAVIIEGPHKLVRGKEIRLITPEGKKIVSVIKDIYLSNREKVDDVSSKLCFIDYIKGVSVKTILQIVD